jgi:hypothetical protein
MKQERKRLFIDKKTGAKERLNIVKFAVENRCDTLVFSLDDWFFKSRNRSLKYIKLMKQHSFFVEAGGRDFSLLFPRRLFLFNRDMLRMEKGKRKADHHFCPTNPKTTAVITKRARILFARAMREVTVPRVFHLLPDEGNENSWCACPACRAFTPAEQNIIAVNTAAAVLEKLDPDAVILYHDFGTEPEAQGVAAGKNMRKS